MRASRYTTRAIRTYTAIVDGEPVRRQIRPPARSDARRYEIRVSLAGTR